MNRPICTKCQIEMKRERIGVIALYMYADPPRPYKAVMADKFKCEKCGTVIVAQFADHPFWEHFHDKSEPNQNDEAVFVVYENPINSEIVDGMSQVQVGGKGNIQSIS